MMAKLEVIDLAVQGAAAATTSLDFAGVAFPQQQPLAFGGDYGHVDRAVHGHRAGVVLDVSLESGQGTGIQDVVVAQIRDVRSPDEVFPKTFVEAPRRDGLRLTKLFGFPRANEADSRVGTNRLLLKNPRSVNTPLSKMMASQS